jgi:hypothetical protein
MATAKMLEAFETMPSLREFLAQPSYNRHNNTADCCCKNGFPKWKLFHLFKRFKDLVSLDTPRWASALIYGCPCRLPRWEQNDGNQADRFEELSYDSKFTDRVSRGQ